MAEKRKRETKDGDDKTKVKKVKKEGINYLNFEAVILTYKSHLDKERVTKHFKERWLVKEIYIAHEIGQGTENGDQEEKGYEHTHVVLRCARTKINPAIGADFDGIHGHIQLVKLSKRKPFQLAINYIADPNKKGGDQSCHHLYKEVPKSIAAAIWKCTTVQQALEEVMEKPGEAMGIISTFNLKNNEKNPDNIEFRHEKKKFQVELENELKSGKHNADQVTWYYDSAGLSGKTTFCKYLMQKKLCTVINGGKNQANILCALENAIKNQWDQKVVIINIARTQKITDELYSTIEIIMDGMFTTEKYNSRTLLTDERVKVYVMSNFAPDTSKLSTGRWIIRTDCT